MERSSAFEYRKTNRGGVGIANMQLGERNGSQVVASFPITDKDQLMLVTDKGKLIRCPVNDIRIAGRQTQGVTLFNVSDEEKVVSVAKLEEMNNSSSSIITGIYPGTFDPITFGHLDIIIRATHIVNELVISVAENIHKKPFFSIKERIDMIEESLKMLTLMNVSLKLLVLITF